jgi:hypothetical protein
MAEGELDGAVGPLAVLRAEAQLLRGRSDRGGCDRGSQDRLDWSDGRSWNARIHHRDRRIAGIQGEGREQHSTNGARSKSHGNLRERESPVQLCNVAAMGGLRVTTRTSTCPGVGGE